MTEQLYGNVQEPRYARTMGLSMASVALVIAGLMADGVTEIYNPAFIARGYEHLEQKLSALGAQVRREDAE